MAAVRAHASRRLPVSRSSPADRAGAERRRGRGRARRRLSYRSPRSSHGRCGIGVRREHGMWCALRRPAGPADEQHPDARVARPCARSRGPEVVRAAGRRAARRRPTSPACSRSRNARTVDAVPASGSSRRRLAPRRTGSRGRAGSSGDLEQPLPDQASAQHQPALRVEVVGEVGGPQLVAGPDLLEGRRAATPVRRSRGRRAAPRSPVAPVEQHARVAGTPAQQACRRSGRGRPGRRVSPPGTRGLRRGQEPADLRVDRGVASTRRTSSARVCSRSASSSASAVGVPRGSRRAGGRRARRRATGGTRALDEAAPGELVDAERDVERDGRPGRGRRAGCRSGGTSTGRARAARPRRRRGCAPPTASSPCGLEDEDVVAVGVDREALRARRREVGVGLARVAELELELGDQVASAAASSGAAPGGRRSRPSSNAASALRASTRPVSGLPASVAPRVYATPAAPSRPGPAGPTASGSRSRSAGGRRRRGRAARPAAPGRCGGGGRGTPRPSREGLGVTAEQVECRRSGGVPVGPSLSVRRRRRRCRRASVPSESVRVAVGAVGVGAVACRRQSVPSLSSAGQCRRRHRRMPPPPVPGVVVMSSSLRGASCVRRCCHAGPPGSGCGRSSPPSVRYRWRHGPSRAGAQPPGRIAYRRRATRM